MAKSTRTKPASTEPTAAEIEAKEKAQVEAEAAAKEKADAEFLEAELVKEEEAEALKVQEAEDAKNEAAVAEAKTAGVIETSQAQSVDSGNYLNQPKELRDAQASQEQIHTPTGTRLTPPMNPFMKMEQERESKRVKSNIPTAADMAQKISTELKIDTTADFVLGSIVAKLNNYITSMAPNTPVTNELGARWQGELAKCFFEALSAAPEASLASLKIIELYFITYSNHTMSRGHVFRFMDMVRLEQQRLLGFQSLLHLFIELGSRGERTNKEIQREVNIGKIADAVSDNTDAQIRLVEFLN